ncbi:MAG: tyrosine-type recombinase/integrase [Candidatus Hydrogenedentes bacterium]|nr:tyrosine-type recombinase/integrase [Candidatus Hydrogenedentota bacterium]
MTHEIELVPESAITQLDANMKGFIEASKAQNTRRAYTTDWEHFMNWCHQRGELALPASPDTVARYVTAMAETRKPATLQRRLASISVAHQAAGYPSPASAPLVRATMQGIRRTLGMAQKQAAPLLVEHVREAVCVLDDSPRGIRDKAILLLGLAGAFRRSELVALDVADLDFQERGVVVTLRRSKTNQEGQPETKDIGFGAHDTTCPVQALKQWLDKAGISEGAIFRAVSPAGDILSRRLQDRAVCRIVKAAAMRIGLSPDAFSGHSLRAGFITQGYREGLPESDIMRHTGHKSRTVMSKYRRESERFLTNFSAKVGL